MRNGKSNASKCKNLIKIRAGFFFEYFNLVALAGALALFTRSKKV